MRKAATLCTTLHLDKRRLRVNVQIGRTQHKVKILLVAVADSCDEQ